MLYKTKTPLGKDGKPLKQSGQAITGYLQSLQLAYNANHELSKSVTITQQGLDLTELTTTYQYDAFGRRISKHTQTKHKTRQVNRSSAKIIKFPVQQQKTKQHQTHYLWDGNRQLQEQTDTHVFTTIYEQDSFEPVARLVWLQDGVSIAANDDPDDEVWTEPKQPASLQVYHFHNDHLGTPNELTDDKGEVVWLADYEAWGNVNKVVYTSIELSSISFSADEHQPLRFQGQFIDQETGLHYNRFRYFDPDLEMFTTRDPIGLLGGNNVFQYAPNPTGWIDPWGLARGRLGSEENPYQTSRAARRAAMREAGIPTSQQPISQSQNASGREYTYRVTDQGGREALASVQQQTMDSSHLEQPHWEAGKVKTDPLTGETRMTNYNRPKLQNDKGKAYYDESGNKSKC